MYIITKNDCTVTIAILESQIKANYLTVAKDDRYCISYISIGSTVAQLYRLEVV